MMEQLVEDSGLNDAKELGKYWAAIQNDIVVCIISMTVPNDTDFDLYREKAKDCLGVLGKVKQGMLVSSPLGIKFIIRGNHRNRGKTPTPAKVIEVSPHVLWRQS
ncbi:MAG: hypothetical protein CSH37_04750 [Thalassolituus sp.]|jgi:hypothetical protein|nr:MAG: hypothetical protein CSH37_04750 [Thalassolituus sp.]